VGLLGLELKISCVREAVNMTKKALCVVNAVGLTPELARDISVSAKLGEVSPLEGVFPALTLPAQATMLTGLLPHEHGIVGNGWYHRETQEVRFWIQAAQIIQGQNIVEEVEAAQMFSWFAQGGSAKWSVIPKPHYGCDGSKAFGVMDGTGLDLEERLGKFPFHRFWGPFSGFDSSRWIADATRHLLQEKRPPLSLVYLPHLDYDYQRNPPGGIGPLDELNGLLESLREACEQADVEMVVVSEYGLEPVERAIQPNRVLREHGWLKVRKGPFGEQLLPWESGAFAVCDHQVAHIHVQRGVSVAEVRSSLLEMEGIEVCESAESLGLGHPRSGELVAISEAGAWFDYAFWEHDEVAPDYTRTIDIHRKPGYDPCELNLYSKGRMALRVAQKKLGARVPMDIIDRDFSRIQGSHGRKVEGEKGPVFIGREGPQRMVDLKPWILDRLS